MWGKVWAKFLLQEDTSTGYRATTIQLYQTWIWRATREGFMLTECNCDTWMTTRRPRIKHRCRPKRKTMCEIPRPDRMGFGFGCGLTDFSSFWAVKENRSDWKLIGVAFAISRIYLFWKRKCFLSFLAIYKIAARMKGAWSLGNRKIVVVTVRISDDWWWLYWFFRTIPKWATQLSLCSVNDFIRSFEGWIMKKTVSMSVNCNRNSVER